MNLGQSIACSIVIFILGGLAFGSWRDSVHQDNAIKRGSAYYHPQTGRFTWKSGNVILKELEK